jgi:putative addiction module component (TIGR02574 family)
MSPMLQSLGIDQLSVAKQDLQRRLDAYEANPKAGSSWEEVKARLQGQP